MKKPDYVDEQHLEYLDDLQSGIVNMYGARPYLMENFGLDEKESTEILKYWMQSFGERHPE